MGVVGVACLYITHSVNSSQREGRKDYWHSPPSLLLPLLFQKEDESEIGFDKEVSVGGVRTVRGDALLQKYGSINS